MEKLINLLNQIKSIVVQDRIMKEERWKRGENFNVFSVLALSRNETRLHSAFIAELLNPNGSHGLCNTFLENFITHLTPGFEFDTAHADVKVEVYIGPINKDSTRGGRIDILVTDNKNHAIIIENKIDASEQEGQLCRYNNYAKDMEFSDYRLLYLTLNGKDSETISDIEKTNYISISYRENILSWLTSCIGIAACYPLIRETIRQYIFNLKEILNIMCTENENRVIELATSKEYTESTLAILRNEMEIKREIRLHFIEELKRLAKQKGLDFTYDEGLIHFWDNQWIVFSQPSVSKKWNVYIGWNKHNKSDGVRYGISRQFTVDTQPIPADKLMQIPHVWTEAPQDEEYPCGWAYLRGKDGKTGNWWNWFDIATLEDMANGTMLHFIETEIIDKVIDGHLLKKVQEILPD